MRTDAAILRAAHKWIVGPHTGLSSITIWAVMMGVPCAHPSIPSDADDLWRCARLLEYVPEWRARLDEIPAEYDRTATYPRWTWTIDRLKDEAACRRLIESRDLGGWPIKVKA